MHTHPIQLVTGSPTADNILQKLTNRFDTKYEGEEIEALRELELKRPIITSEMEALLKVHNDEIVSAEARLRAIETNPVNAFLEDKIPMMREALKTNDVRWIDLLEGDITRYNFEVGLPHTDYKPESTSPVSLEKLHELSLKNKENRRRRLELFVGRFGRGVPAGENINPEISEKIYEDTRRVEQARKERATEDFARLNELYIAFVSGRAPKELFLKALDISTVTPSDGDIMGMLESSPVKLPSGKKVIKSDIVNPLGVTYITIEPDAKVLHFTIDAGGKRRYFKGPVDKFLFDRLRFMRKYEVPVPE